MGEGLSLYDSSSALDRLVRDDGTKTVTIRACHIVGLVTDYQVHIQWF